MRIRSLALVVLLLASPLVFSACDSGGDERIVAGVDFDLLFAPPTAQEKAAILSEWAGRDVRTQDAVIVAVDTVSSGGRVFDAAIVSYTVAGAKQYGAFLIPHGTFSSLPAVVYAHGGDAGVKVEDAATLAAALSPTGRDYVWIVPAFRDEPLKFRDKTYQSEGPASPWDYDVDDALTLLSNTNRIISYTALIDTSRVGVVGISRGGDVGLLMAIRDARIKQVLDLFGPTDFFGPYVQDIVEDALREGRRDLPGFDVLNTRFVEPLKAGTITTAQMRLELLRRSPVYFTDRLPAVQVQHGTEDDVVDISQSRRLADVMQGRAGFSYFEWAGGEHTPFSFPINWLFEAQTFLGRL